MTSSHNVFLRRVAPKTSAKTIILEFMKMCFVCDTSVYYISFYNNISIIIDDFWQWVWKNKCLIFFFHVLKQITIFNKSCVKSFMFVKYFYYIRTLFKIPIFEISFSFLANKYFALFLLLCIRKPQNINLKNFLVMNSK